MIFHLDASCDGIFTPDAINLIKECLAYFRILAPIALILFVAIDLFSHGILGQDSKAKEIMLSKITRRIIAVLLIFFIPTIVTVLLDAASFNQYSADYMCTKSTGTASEKLVAYYGTGNLSHNESAQNLVITNPKAEQNPKNQNGNGQGNGNGNGNSGSGNGNGSSQGGSNGGSNGGSSGGGAIGGSNGGSSGGGAIGGVGPNANSKNEVCLENQAGARDRYQSELEAKVNGAGTRTRAGVVAAAKYISSEIGIKVPYFPGGCHTMKCYYSGIPKNIGCNKNVSHNASKWPPQLPAGFDCSGFTFWSYGQAFGHDGTLSSEMHNPANSSASVNDANGNKLVSVKVERVDITKNNIDYIKNLLLPGDLVGTNGHVGMVIDTSRLQSEGVYTVAHASSQYMQLTVETFKLAPKNKWEQVVLMRKFFLKYDCLRRGDQSACQNFDCINDKNCNSYNIKY